MEPHGTFDVSSWEVFSDETSGADVKLWVKEPSSGDLWLYKAITDKNGHQQGEDWAELAASQVASALGVPCAQIRLAEHDGRRGAISRDLIPASYELQPGFVVMQAHPIPGFQPGNVKGRPGHSLANIQEALQDTSAPPDADVPKWMDGFGVFAGYTLLDALIANRDRHDENWAVLLPTPSTGARLLCGTYDHAGSLGYNLTDTEREDRLAGDGSGVLKWAERGTAWRLEHTPGQPIMTLAAAADQAFDLAGPAVREYWLERLDGIDQTLGDVALAGLPGLSAPCSNFVSSLLDINKRRVFDVCGRGA